MQNNLVEYVVKATLPLSVVCECQQLFHSDIKYIPINLFFIIIYH